MAKDKKKATARYVADAPSKSFLDMIAPSAEEDRIIQNATNKNRMGSSNTNDLRQTVTAESNLQGCGIADSIYASQSRAIVPLRGLS